MVKGTDVPLRQNCLGYHLICPYGLNLHPLPAVSGFSFFMTVASQLANVYNVGVCFNPYGGITVVYERLAKILAVVSTLFVVGGLIYWILKA